MTKAPKTRAGRRTLPLPDSVTAALRALKAAQARERLALGADHGLVAVNAAGEPLKTDTLRRYVQALMRKTGMRQVSLYSARHSALTMLVVNGVPDAIVSTWAGHSDITTTKRNYVKPSAAALLKAKDTIDAVWGSTSKAV